MIAYRQAREKLVERVASFPIQTPIGELQGYAYRTPFDPVLHFAFVHGSIGDGRNVPARLHRADILSDVFGAGPIPKVLARFKAEGRGALVYLRDGSAGVPANLGGAHANGSDDARETQWRKSALARRSCATSGSPRSGCAPTIHAPMSGLPASASRSQRSSRSRAEAPVTEPSIQPTREISCAQKQ